MSDSIESTNNELPEPTESEIEQVEALLTGKPLKSQEKAPETGQDDAPGGDAAAEEGEEAEPDAEGDEGEEPDTEAKAFYAQPVKLSDGSTMSVGELKDLAQGWNAKQVELIERENGVMKQRNELEEIVQYLQLPPEVRERIQHQQTEYLSQQHNQMLAAIPEFQDRAQFEKGRVAIFDLGTEYGVDLSRVTDHRVVKMLHDFARLKVGIKAAKDNVKQIRTPEPKAKHLPPKGRQSELNTAIDRAKQTGNAGDIDRAVGQLLKG